MTANYTDKELKWLKESPPAKVTIINRSASIEVVEIKEVLEGRGGKRLEITLDEIVAENISREGAIKAAMRIAYGAESRPVKR